MAIPTHILSPLVDALAELYPEPADARAMVRFAGLDERQIDFSGKAGNTWSSIVREADLQGRTSAVLARAEAQYPIYAPLTAATQAYSTWTAAGRSAEAPSRPLATAGSTEVPSARGQLFLSYSRHDRDYVARLAADLQAHGYGTWYDDRIDLGHRWWRTIEKAIETCAGMVVVMSPEARESEWVEKEILLAQQEGKPILPLLLRGKGLPLLIDKEYADVRGDQLPPADFYTRLRRVVPPAAVAAPAAAEPAKPAPATRTAPVPVVPIATEPPAAVPDEPRPRRRIPGWVWLAAGAAAVVLLVLGLLNGPWQAIGSATPTSAPAVSVPRFTSAPAPPTTAPAMTAIPTRLVVATATPRTKNSTTRPTVPAVVPTMTATSTRFPTATATPSVIATRQLPPSPVAFDWVEIPAGEFTMGNDPEQDSLAKFWEPRQHSEFVHNFRIARTEVTVAQFAVFVEATGYQTTAEKAGNTYTWRTPRGSDSSVDAKLNHPVTQVSWDDAQAFSAWAGVRLPTEAEWEKACRGTGGQRIYPWGNAPPDDSRANYNSNYNVGDTTAVGSYPAGKSPYGLLDMSGNVWEWTQTKWRNNYNTPADNSQQGPQSRVGRGGSWGSDESDLRCASRAPYSRGVRDVYFGFRVVASP